MRELEYPFDNDLILQKKKSFRRELMEDGNVRIKKNIAILGGSTTALVAQILDLFLLNAGIEATFYESEYNQFYEDACFKNPELESFGADVFYIHTSIHNINYWPSVNDSPEEVLAKEDKVFNYFNNSAKVFNSSSKFSLFSCLISSFIYFSNLLNNSLFSEVTFNFTDFLSYSEV